MVQESCVDCAVVSDFLSDPLHLIVLLQPIVTPFLACELQQRFHFWSACSHLWVCLVITISSRFYLFCTFSNHPSYFTCTFHVYRTKNYIIHYVFSRYFLISVNKINIILHFMLSPLLQAPPSRLLLPFPQSPQHFPLVQLLHSLQFPCFLWFLQFLRFPHFLWFPQPARIPQGFPRVPPWALRIRVPVRGREGLGE